jgi:hypothetical protein
LPAEQQRLLLSEPEWNARLQQHGVLRGDLRS